MKKLSRPQLDLLHRLAKGTVKLSDTRTADVLVASGLATHEGSVLMNRVFAIFKITDSGYELLNKLNNNTVK